MSQFATIQIEGAKEIAGLLRQIGDKGLQKQLRLAHKMTAEVVAASARQKVPVRSGNLRKSIRAGGTQKAAMVRAGGKAVPYAAPTHWGRRVGNVGSPPGNRMGPNPVQGRRFLWDAGNASVAKAAEVYRREVAAVFDQLGTPKAGG